MSDEDYLLAHVLGKNPAFIYANPHPFLTPEQSHLLASLQLRYQQGEPLAYLMGQRGFWDHDFIVTPAVLIPRPESEGLVEVALDFFQAQPHRTRCLDMGTGSGCIAISLALVCPRLSVLGVDQDDQALEIAQLNAKQLGAQEITWIQSCWFEDYHEAPVDVIVSNPPYIRAGDPHLPALRFEPQQALVSGETGLEALIHLIHHAPAHLTPGGLLALEHGFDQAEAVAAAFIEKGYQVVETLKDLQGHPRITTGRWNDE